MISKKVLKSAFTLVELLVVIAIIGILSGLIIVGMSSSVSNAKIAKAQIFSASLRDSLLANLVSEWDFDDSANLGVDIWGGLNCTSNGGVVSQSTGCVYGKCLSLNGTDSYINCVGYNKYNASTIALWINGTRGQSVGGIVMSGGASLQRWGICLSGGSIASLITNETASDWWTIESYSLTNFPNGWNFIVVTNDGTIRKYYKDGTYISQHTNTITNSGSNVDVRIGRGGSADASYFAGLIDDVRIFNAAIPTSQIKEMYYAGINKLLAKSVLFRGDYINIIREMQ